MLYTFLQTGKLLPDPHPGQSFRTGSPSRVVGQVYPCPSNLNQLFQLSKYGVGGENRIGRTQDCRKYHVKYANVFHSSQSGETNFYCSFSAPLSFKRSPSKFNSLHSFQPSIVAKLRHIKTRISHNAGRFTPVVFRRHNNVT